MGEKERERFDGWIVFFYKASLPLEVRVRG